MQRSRASAAVMVVWLACVFLTSCKGASPEHIAMREASKNCRQWVKESAKNPTSARIPAPSAVHRVAGQIVVQWERGDGLTLMNGFGANVDTTARCRMSSDGQFLKELVVDEKLIRRSDTK